MNVEDKVSQYVHALNTAGIQAEETITLPSFLPEVPGLTCADLREIDELLWQYQDLRDS